VGAAVHVGDLGLIPGVLMHPDQHEQLVVAGDAVDGGAAVVLAVDAGPAEPAVVAAPDVALVAAGDEHSVGEADRGQLASVEPVDAAEEVLLPGDPVGAAHDHRVAVPVVAAASDRHDHAVADGDRPEDVLLARLGLGIDHARADDLVPGQAVGRARPPTAVADRHEHTLRARIGLGVVTVAVTLVVAVAVAVARITGLAGLVVVA